MLNMYVIGAVALFSTLGFGLVVTKSGLVQDVMPAAIVEAVKEEVVKETDSSSVSKGGAAQNEIASSSVEASTAASEAGIDPFVMTDGQKKLLESFGIDPHTMTITPQMIACAEASLGASRVEELKVGATPTFSEGIKLLACYK